MAVVFWSTCRLPSSRRPGALRLAELVAARRGAEAGPARRGPGRGPDGTRLGISRGGMWDGPTRLVIVAWPPRRLCCSLRVPAGAPWSRSMLDLTYSGFRMTSRSAIRGPRSSTGAVVLRRCCWCSFLHFQGAQGDDPIPAGVKLAPWPSGRRPLRRLAGVQADRHGSRILAPLGMLLFASGSPMTTPRRRHPVLAERALWLLLVGVGPGMFQFPQHRP